jgi:hypothetical protein
VRLTEEQVDRLATLAHQLFRDDLRARGFRYGPVTNARRRTHRALVPFDQLPPELREQNRDSVREIPAKLAAVGYAIVAGAGAGDSPFAFTPDEVERLAELEHRRWTEVHRAAGWRAGPTTDRSARRHPNLVPWADLPEADKEKDRVLVRAIPGLLAGVGLRIERTGGA